MNLEDRIKTFVELGKRLVQESNSASDFPFKSVVEQAQHHNPWFTPENVRYALNSIVEEWLQPEILQNWVSKYPENCFNPKSQKRIGVIMAGNIPFVGFHDMLCVLITGNRFLGKFSSKDGDLMKAVTTMICEIAPEFKGYISITDENLKEFDAILATGSNTSSKYFEYYFKNHPSIIRKHRNSIAVLTGSETVEDFQQLGNDIFTYYGLGCRNVSKVFVPINYNFSPFIDELQTWQKVAFNSKYCNNYEFHRALFLMNNVEHLDNGFLLIRSEETISSPVSVLHYQTYNNIDKIKTFIAEHNDELQCIVCKDGLIDNSIPFGYTQKPAIDEYADGIDTVTFLGNL